MRKYEPIWRALKAKGEAKLTAPVSNHARIIQAVRKEKTNDRGWKLLMLEAGKTYKLKEIVTGKLIAFKLEEVETLIMRL